MPPLPHVKVYPPKFLPTRVVVMSTLTYNFRKKMPIISKILRKLRCHACNKAAPGSLQSFFEEKTYRAPMKIFFEEKNFHGNPSGALPHFLRFPERDWLREVFPYFHSFPERGTFLL